MLNRKEVEATCFLTTAFLIEASVCEMQWQRKNNRINQTIISVVLIIISKIQYHVFQIIFTIQYIIGDNKDRTIYWIHTQICVSYKEIFIKSYMLKS